MYWDYFLWWIDTYLNTYTEGRSFNRNAVNAINVLLGYHWHSEPEHHTATGWPSNSAVSNFMSCKLTIVVIQYITERTIPRRSSNLKRTWHCEAVNITADTHFVKCCSSQFKFNFTHNIKILTDFSWSNLP